MATATINSEMDFTWELARRLSPEGIAKKYQKLDTGEYKARPKVSKTLGGE
jgi:hypothetical protein